MKVNDKGRPCPAWCRVDHEAEADRSCYGRELTVKAEPSVAGAEASLGAYQKEPEISAWIYGPQNPGGLHGGRVTVQDAWGAERLARGPGSRSRSHQAAAPPAGRASSRGRS